MHILLSIHHYLDPNAGAPGVTLKLGQEYQKAGHQVSYFSLDNLPSRLPGIIKAIVFPYWLAIHLLFHYKKQPIDVIDASTGDAWFWAKLFRYFSHNKIVLITRSHGLEHSMHIENLEESARGNLNLSWKYPLYHGGFRLWEVKSSIKDADLTLMLNSRDRDYADCELEIASEKLTIVPNGIPEEFINLPWENTLMSPKETIRIAQVGSFIDRKGIKYSIPALNHILDRFDNVEMTFVGTGCAEDLILSNFSADIRHKIKVVPHYNHQALPNLLKAHHIKLFPSLSEGFSLALVEAMACGLAPIASSNLGLTELLTDRHNSISIPSRNSKAIEDALEKLILNRSELDRIRRNAYQTAQDYNWVNIAHKNLALYQKLHRQKKAEKALDSSEAAN
ncbi:MAG TPA: glycosyltransferase family 4 protein [Coleofasciculaceae cyanobacterium]|jgi:glycosyltransferase involved in cell wall biosynthesis